MSDPCPIHKHDAIQVSCLCYPTHCGQCKHPIESMPTPKNPDTIIDEWMCQSRNLPVSEQEKWLRNALSNVLLFAAEEAIGKRFRCGACDSNVSSLSHTQNCDARKHLLDLAAKVEAGEEGE